MSVPKRYAARDLQRTPFAVPAACPSRGCRAGCRRHSPPVGCRRKEGSLPQPAVTVTVDRHFRVLSPRNKQLAGQSAGMPEPFRINVKGTNAVGQLGPFDGRMALLPVTEALGNGQKKSTATAGRLDDQPATDVLLGPITDHIEHPVHNPTQRYSRRLSLFLPSYESFRPETNSQHSPERLKLTSQSTKILTEAVRHTGRKKFYTQAL